MLTVEIYHVRPPVLPILMIDPLEARRLGRVLSEASRRAAKAGIQQYRRDPMYVLRIVDHTQQQKEAAKKKRKAASEARRRNRR